MRKYIAILMGVLALGFAWSRLGVAHPPSAARAALPTDVPVIVELFSSEGCSSCPPADAYLAELDRAQPVEGVSVIALEEHVDYWDDLGWRDPFAQPTFGPRQRQYASTLSDHRVFTPEIVIDGRAISDGDPDKAAREMQAARQGPRAHVGLTRKGDRVSVEVSDVPTGPGDASAEVWFAVTERGLSTRVERGENAGHILTHAPVVRVLRKLGPVAAGSFRSETPLELSAAWNPAALRAVVFVQRARSREIVGAAELGLRP